MQDWHVKGNSKADELASTAAAFHAIPDEKAKPSIDLLEDLTLIPNRIITVIKLYPQRAHNAPIMLKFQLTPKQKVFDASRWSSHDLHIDKTE